MQTNGSEQKPGEEVFGKKDHEAGPCVYSDWRYQFLCFTMQRDAGCSQSGLACQNQGEANLTQGLRVARNQSG